MSEVLKNINETDQQDPNQDDTKIAEFGLPYPKTEKFAFAKLPNSLAELRWLDGHTLKGSYFIDDTKPSYRGGTGITFSGIANTGDVMIKLLTAVGIDPAEKRFQNESKILARIKHPNLVAYIESKTTGCYPWIIFLERIPGKNLSETLESIGPLAPKKALFVCREVALALDYLHKLGIFHRDIKPENIVMTPNGEVKVVDLGSAHDVTIPSDITSWFGSPGTTRWMPKGGNQPTAESDLYNLTLVLHYLVTTKLPCYGVKPSCDEAVFESFPALKKFIQDSLDLGKFHTASEWILALDLLFLGAAEETKLVEMVQTLQTVQSEKEAAIQTLQTVQTEKEAAIQTLQTVQAEKDVALETLRTTEELRVVSQAEKEATIQALQTVQFEKAKKLLLLVLSFLIFLALSNEGLKHQKKKDIEGSLIDKETTLKKEKKLEEAINLEKEKADQMAKDLIRQKEEADQMAKDLIRQKEEADQMAKDLIRQKEEADQMAKDLIRQKEEELEQTFQKAKQISETERRTIQETLDVLKQELNKKLEEDETFEDEIRNNKAKLKEEQEKLEQAKKETNTKRKNLTNEIDILIKKINEMEKKQ